MDRLIRDGKPQDPGRRFLFNTPDGRCPACEGQGVKRLEMKILPST